MTETVYDFDINLINSDMTRRLTDSTLVCIEFDFRTSLMASRIDFSTSSSVRLRNEEEIRYLSIHDYCETTEVCGRQLVYILIFEYASLFDFNFRDSVEFAPEFLIRESLFFDALKIKGYEFYGFVSNRIFFLLRGHAYAPPLIDITSTMFIPSFSSKPMMIRSEEPYIAIQHLKINQYMLPIDRYILKPSFYNRIISSAPGSSILKFAEMNSVMNDELFGLMSLSILAFSDTLTGLTISFVPASFNLDAQVGATLDPAFFGIMLHKPQNITYDFVSNDMSITITTQE